MRKEYNKKEIKEKLKEYEGYEYKIVEGQVLKMFFCTKCKPEKLLGTNFSAVPYHQIQHSLDELKGMIDKI